jgi:hypothetical protein
MFEVRAEALLGCGFAALGMVSPELAGDWTEKRADQWWIDQANSQINAASAPQSA